MISGIYEKPLLKILKTYYENKGYKAILHARLNISWSSIISDVDLLIKNKNQAVAIEVKSIKDNFKKGFIQLDKIAPFVDKVYLATDNEKMIKRYKDFHSYIGLIYVDKNNNTVIIKKSALKYPINISIKNLYNLRICCLQEIAKEFNILPYQSKLFLAMDIIKYIENRQIKLKLKKIVTFNEHFHLHISK